MHVLQFFAASFANLGAWFCKFVPGGGACWGLLVGVASEIHLPDHPGFSISACSISLDKLPKECRQWSRDNGLIIFRNPDVPIKKFYLDLFTFNSISGSWMPVLQIPGAKNNLGAKFCRKN